MNRLKELRNLNGVKASDLAELIGLKTNAAYYKKESGSIKFTAEEALMIAKYFKKPVEEIFLTKKVPKKNFGSTGDKNPQVS